MDAQPPTQQELLALYWEFADWTVRSYGPLVWLGAVLAGLCFYQCASYFRNPANRDDPKVVKAMVIFMTTLQLLSSVFECVGHAVQDRYMSQRVIGPGMFAPWTDAYLILFSTLSGLCAQAYYGHLVYRLAQTSINGRRYAWIWVCVFGFMWLAVGSTGITTCVFFTYIPERNWIPAVYGITLKGPAISFYITWITCGAALDFTLSIILLTRFVRGIRRDGFAQTNSILSRLAIATFETFALTTTVAMVDLVCAAGIATGSVISQVKMQIVCYFLTVLVARSYCFSFIFTLVRHAEIRAMRNAGGSSAGHKSAGYIYTPANTSAKAIRISPLLSRSGAAHGGPGGPHNAHPDRDQAGSTGTAADIELSTAVSQPGLHLSRAHPRPGHDDDGDVKRPGLDAAGGVRIETEKEQRIEQGEPGSDFVLTADLMRKSRPAPLDDDDL